MYRKLKQIVNDNAIIANIIEKELTLIVTWSRACIVYSMWEAFGLL